ncbi:unnamed protein product [Thlaspi arvense]|uniref:TF-B3 domain-containing protein n=1 Tax=Thlaspi arvense TaxID=13288 RepID=A0AAU9SC71_THLAR|nr:unnamed protein product [Thlaspi arvense]
MMRYDDDDQRGERSLSEILMARLRAAHGDEETRARRGVEEEERNRFLIDTILSVAADSFFGKRETTDESDSQQNPNRRDASSSSSKSDDEPVKPSVSVKGKSVKGLKKKGKVLRGSGSSHGNAYENMEVDDPYVATEAVLGKRKRKTDEYESQQNQDASSSVEPVRIERAAMPEWVVDRMRKENATDAKLITEKSLTVTDLNTQQARLLIPFNQMEEMDLLNEAEQTIIEQHLRKTRRDGVPVNLVDQKGNQWKLNLKRWDMKASCNYVLNSGWNCVNLHNRFKKDQIIRLWSFHSQRGEQELFFALEIVPASALTQAQDPFPLPAAASSSSPAPAATRDSEELCIGEEASRIKAQEERFTMLTNFPKKRRSATVRVPATTRDSDQNRTLAPVEAEEETSMTDMMVAEILLQLASGQNS